MVQRTVIQFAREEHELKLQHMQAAHEMAIQEHKLKIEILAIEKRVVVMKAEVASISNGRPSKACNTPVKPPERLGRKYVRQGRWPARLGRQARRGRSRLRW